MGYLHYGERASFQFDDRTLTHLRTVIFGKLSLQESFVFTWSAEGSQRSIWLHPAASLQFEFEAEETPDINATWIEQLMTLASMPSGLRLVDEPRAAGSG